MYEEGKAFLGTGWSFPPAFSRISYEQVMSYGDEDIEQSLHIILDTIPGERIMQPEFGCHIHRLVFGTVDSAFTNEANDVIRYALLQFEPRINFIGAEVLLDNMEDGIVYIKINYTIITTNTRHNIVYPFYLREGTNLT